MSEPSLFQTLPSTTDDAVLNHLSIEEIICFGKTCKNAHIAAQSYFKRKFKLGDVLSRFFPADGDVEELRTLMSDTGAVISGSIALQFIDRIVYPESDLDIYVPLHNTQRVADWLSSKGYTYTPAFAHLPQLATVGLAISDAAGRHSMPAVSSKSPSARRGYLRAACILDFTATRPVQKVQVIASARSVMELILGFHSTCVMNVITHEKAYSLFPRATLIERRALTHLHRTLGHQSNIQAHLKWTERGYELGSSLTRGEFEDPRSAFAPGPRSVGDSHCLVIPIHPIRNDLATPERSGTIEVNSFTLAYNKRLFPVFKSWHLNLYWLKYPYVATAKEAALIMHWISREITPGGSLHLAPVNRTESSADYPETFDPDLLRLMHTIRKVGINISININDSITEPPESDSEPEDDENDNQGLDSVPEEFNATTDDSAFEE